MLVSGSSFPFRDGFHVSKDLAVVSFSHEVTAVNDKGSLREWEPQMRVREQEADTEEDAGTGKGQAGSTGSVQPAKGKSDLAGRRGWEGVWC
jgi:hypothetical protein